MRRASSARSSSLTDEHLHREEIADVLALDARIAAHGELYDWVRPHDALGQAPPMARYLGRRPTSATDRP